MAGVTNTGFELKTLDQIIADIKDRLKNLFGPNIDLNDTSTFSRLTRVESLALFEIWGQLLNTWNSGFIKTASGESLDNLVVFAGLTRKQPSKAVGIITITGDVGTTIPTGFQVQTSDVEPIIFETTNTNGVQIPVEGFLDLEIVALNGGDNTNVAARTINTVTNALSGVESVINENSTQGGEDLETDANLRYRYLQSVDLVGGNSTNAIRSNILQQTDATRCVVIENATTETVDGIPPNAFEPIVVGGTEQDIAEAILEKKAAGIRSFGTNIVPIQDDSGNTIEIGFTYAQPTQIYINFTLNKDDSTYPFNGDTLVKDTIISYIGGTDSNGNYQEGLNLGFPVIYTQIINKILDIPGTKDVLNLKIGTSSSPTGTSNIDIGIRNYAQTSINSIVINDA